MCAFHRVTRSFGVAIPLLAAATALAAQSSAEVALTRTSTLYADWLNEGAESPNGRFVVFRSYAGEGYVRYDRSTRQWAEAKDLRIGSPVRWSPDGRFLAYSRRGDVGPRAVWIMQIDTATGLPRGTPRRISTSPATWPAWSPDGRRIAYAAVDSGRFRVVIAPFNGGDEQVVYDVRGNGGDVAWSPDGKFLAAHSGGAESPPVWVRIDLVTRKVDSFPAPAFRVIGYSPDGQRFAHLDQTQGILVISSATTGKPLQRLKLPSRVRPTGWSRSTSNAFTAIENVVPAHFQRVTLPEGRLSTLTPIDSVSALGAIRHSPDGGRLSYTQEHGGWARLHVMNRDGSADRTVGMSGILTQHRWSPSGKYIAYVRRILDAKGDVTSSVRIVEVATGVDRELVSPRGSAAAGTALAWRTDNAAVRYVWFPNGERNPPREIREVALDGQDRLIASVAAIGTAHFINDTLLVIRKTNGVDGLSLRTGAVRPLFSGSIRGRSDVGVSYDGSWLVLAANSGDDMYPLMVSLSSGATRKVAYSLKGELAAIFFHPDGRRLIAEACLSCVAPLYVEKWDIVEIPMNGDAPRVLTASQRSYKDHSVGNVAPDGLSIVFEGQQSYNTRVVTVALPRP